MTRDKVWAWVVIGVVVCATLSPMVPEFRGRKGDSFPLSWFPMFAGERPRYENPTYVVGENPDGSRVKVDVSFWTSGGFNQGRNMLTQAIHDHDSQRFCDKIAKKVAKRGRPEHRDVVVLKIVKGTYDRATFFGGDTTPLRERILSECVVPR